MASLCSLVSLTAGCIVPQQFRDIPAEANFPPAIQFSLADPGFGRFSGMVKKAFNVVVDDPNIDDQLTAQILERTPMGDKFTGWEDAMPTVDPQNLARRTFALPTTDGIVACDPYDDGALLVFRVKDKGGLTDESIWLLQCQ